MKPIQSINALREAVTQYEHKHGTLSISGQSDQSTVNGGCYYGCTDTCEGTCSGDCTGSCSGTCSGSSA
jgi:modification target Cys-rich repeat protein